MMHFPSRASLSATLAVAILLVAAAPVATQSVPLANGHGTYVGQNGEFKEFAFAAVELANGEVRGSCVVIEPATHGLVCMLITSSAMVDGTLFLAGPITAATNAPSVYVVGATGFFGVHDSGRSSFLPDEFAGLSAAPASLGNLTDQQILAFIGPPPSSAFAPLWFGNIRICSCRASLR